MLKGRNALDPESSDPTESDADRIHSLCSGPIRMQAKSLDVGSSQISTSKPDPQRPLDIWLDSDLYPVQPLVEEKKNKQCL